jgi:hypothetical protein
VTRPGSDCRVLDIASTAPHIPDPLEGQRAPLPGEVRLTVARGGYGQDQRNPTLEFTTGL